MCEHLEIKSDLTPRLSEHAHVLPRVQGASLIDGRALCAEAARCGCQEVRVSTDAATAEDNKRKYIDFHQLM